MLNSYDNTRGIEDLTDLGVLVEVTGHERNRRFRYKPYVPLFDKPRGGAND